MAFLDQQPTEPVSSHKYTQHLWGIAEFAGLEFAGLENDGVEQEETYRPTYCTR